MDNYEEIFEDTIGRLVEVAREELKTSDFTVRKLESELAELGTTDSNPELDLYIGKLNALTALREEYLYKQGARDCVLLLKRLGVIA